SYDTLDVWIDCLANCGQDKYNPRRNVRLKGNCHNCHNNDEITYDWYVDGYLMLSTRIFLMFIKNPANNVVIELKVSTKSGRRGSQQVSLERTRVPRNGNCVVRPTVGWEVDTKFSLCCANFTTKHLPIEYFSYAGDVLLKNCMDCKCSMRLQAHMTEIYILV
ncbi:CG42619, partial [Drosophila busckii]